MTHVPFTVNAYMQQGASMDSRFGVALDGLLTSQARDAAKRRVGDPALTGSLLDGGLHSDTLADVDLPLARCDHDPWHWAATTAYPLDHDGNPLPVDPDVHYLSSSHDSRPAEQTARKLPLHIPAAAGRYRSRRLPVVTFPAARLQWRGVGDPDAVQALLSSVWSIGAHRGVGEGTVLRWEVTAHPDADPDHYAHLHLDATLGAPAPQVCADRVGATGAGTGRCGIRPPYWHHERQHALVLPGYSTRKASPCPAD